MSDYPIFSRTLVIAIPTCVTVPIFGALVGALVAAAAVLLVVRGLMQ